MSKRVESVVVTILGQKFRVEHEHGQTYISHPKWSLVGHGEFYTDAFNDLLEEAAIFVQHFDNQPPESLSKNAQKALAYAKRLGRMTAPISARENP